MVYHDDTKNMTWYTPSKVTLEYVFVLFAPSMFRTLSSSFSISVIAFHPHAGPGNVWVMTQSSPSIRARTPGARPPETVQSQSGHVSGGTFFVAVASRATLREPYAPRA